FLGDGFFVAINENGIFIDREFAALEKTAAFAARVNPDVVVFEIVFFGVSVAANAVSNAAVRSDAEGSDFFVDGLDGLFRLLRFPQQNRMAARVHADQRTECAEPAKTTAGERADHGLGCAAV